MLDINKLKHNATNGFGVRLQGQIVQSEEDADVYFLYEKGTNKQLGYIDLTVLKEKSVVYVNDMENLRKGGSHPYRGIGSLLHEFVYYMMAKNNVDLPIQLTVAHASHVFHYKCGYRFANNNDNEAMDALIDQGPDAYMKKENLKGFPETMGMSQEVVNEKKRQYSDLLGVEGSIKNRRHY